MIVHSVLSCAIKQLVSPNLGELYITMASIDCLLCRIVFLRVVLLIINALFVILAFVSGLSGLLSVGLCFLINYFPALRMFLGV